MEGYCLVTFKIPESSYTECKVNGRIPTVLALHWLTLLTSVKSYLETFCSSSQLCCSAVSCSVLMAPYTHLSEDPWGGTPGCSFRLTMALLCPSKRFLRTAASQG